MRVTRDPRAAEIERSEERVFLPGRENPVVLRRNSKALFLLQRVRDEAHRFAITYHRALARERARSALEPDARCRRRAPAAAAARLRQRPAHARATVEELGRVPGIAAGLAGRIKEQLATA